MKLLPNKAVLCSVLLSCTMLFTLNAAAKEVAIEQNLAATVQAQGQQAVRDISAKLSNSIRVELKRFSSRYSTVQTQELAALVKPATLPQLKQQTSEKL